MPSPVKSLLALFVLLGLTFVVAESSFSGDWQEVVSPRTRVLFEDPRLAGYAIGVAARAEAALSELAELFGSVPPLTTISLDGNTDLYTAIAPPLPRPRVVLPALFPTVPQVDLGTGDPLYALLLHELTHTAQLGYLDRPAKVPPLPRLGLVGEAVAPLPPGWLLEGLAVWLTSTRAPSPGSTESRTRGVLNTLALEGEWPSLEDVSLLSHAEWPGGEARYLLGGAFVAYLVEHHGWEAVLAALREANAGWYPLPFETAWRRATGTELEAEWGHWRRLVEQQAVARASLLQPELSLPLTGGGRASEVLALDPTGSRLAWRPAGGGLVVSPLLAFEGGALALGAGERVLPPHQSPVDVDWVGDGRLVYTRLAPAADHRFTGLFELDLETGRERRLSFGTRARFARAGPDDCLYYVLDIIGTGSELWRQCGEEVPVRHFGASAGSHIVGLAVSAEGQVALSLWRDGYVDLALLEDGQLHWLMQDAAQDLDPTWRDEDELIFSSDRTGVFELFRLTLGAERVVRLAPELGGAFAPTFSGDRLLYARLGGAGLDLAALGHEQTAGRYDLVADPLPQTSEFDARYPVRDYRPFPSLAPFGWLPALEVVDLSSFTLAPSLSILGQDSSGDHSYSFSAGFDPALAGSLSGGWAALRYDFRATDAFDLFQRPPPSGFGVQLGLWPHEPHLRPARETATGLMTEYWSRTRSGSWAQLLQLRIGALYLDSNGALQPDARLDLVASRRLGDLWGYGVRGPRLSAHLLWSADSTGGSVGAWADVSQVLPRSVELPFTTFYSLRAGYRPLPPVPVAMKGWAAFAGMGARRSFPVQWRYADGLAALERLTVEARSLAAYDGRIAVAGDFSLWADTMVRYGAPLSVGGSVGYARGWWYRFGFRLPL